MADETRRVPPDETEYPEAARTRRVEEPAATRRVTEDALATQLLAQPAAPPTHHPLGALAPGHFLCGDYQVQRTLQPHETTRPGLYLCQGPEGQVVIKVAAAQFPPKPDLWNRLSALQHPNVLRTYHTLEEDGFFYEVQEYCAGGTLEDRVPRPGSGTPAMTAQRIMAHMIPQVNAALKYLHGQEIIHRDVKPANVYIKESGGREVLVLGDFDISAVLEQTRTSRDTQRAAGTWLYTAPEAFPRFVDDHAGSRRGRITRSADYYALGITIIELLMGTTSLHLCQLPDLFDFYLQGGRVEIPQGIDGRLATLLRGLLVRNRHTRWGAAEVDRWLENRTSDDDMKRIMDDDYFELARASRPYRLNDRSAVDLPGLAEAMFREPDVATEDLITGDILLNWIGTLDPAIARAIRRDRDKLYLYPEMMLHAAIMRCDPTRPFIFFDNHEVNSPEEWLAHAIALMSTQHITPEALGTEELLRQLEVWLRLKAEPLSALADAVAEIQQSPARVRLEELAYLFQPDRPFMLARGISAHTPHEFVSLAYGRPEEWKTKRPPIYEAAYQRWLDGALLAWLRQRGMGELAARCDAVRAELGDETPAAFETVLRLLHPALPPVSVEFDTAEIPPECQIAYGRERAVTLRYTTRGPGVPFGALLLHGDVTGLQLSENVLRAREGSLALNFTLTREMASGKSCQARVELDSGIARAVNAPVKINYRMVFPAEATTLRVAIGAGIGAGIIGLPRLLAALLGRPNPFAGDELLPGTLWDTVTADKWQFPQWDLAVALLILLVCIYFGLRIWLQALKNSLR